MYYKYILKEMSTVCPFFFTLSCQAVVCFYLRICVCIRSPEVNPSGHMQTAVSLQLAAHKAKGQLAEQFIHVMSLFPGFIGSRGRSPSTYEGISKALSLREPLTVFESASPKLVPRPSAQSRCCLPIPHSIEALAKQIKYSSLLLTALPHAE